MNVQKHSRILVFRAGALGDFILTLPLLQALREAWPYACIELVARADAGSLAVDAGLADRVISIDSARIAMCYSPIGIVDATFANYIRSLDAVISLLHDPDEVVRKNLLRTGVSQLVCLSPIVKSHHAVDHFLAALEPLGLVPPRNLIPHLNLPEAYRQRGMQRLSQIGPGLVLGRILAVHPGSGSRRKNWPLENFLTVADRARRELSFSPVFVLGEAEKDIGYALKEENHSLLELPSLVDLAAFLTICSAYIGNDSGVTHLAAALNVPTVAIFGPTDPTIWGPRGRNVRILKRFPASECCPPDVEVEKVLDALSSLADQTKHPGIEREGNGSRQRAPVSGTAPLL